MKKTKIPKHRLLSLVIITAFISFGSSRAVDASQISGFVWLDNNGNGLQDTDEPGFAQTVPGLGAPNIALYPVGSTELIDFLYLDESSQGRYSFDNLADGEYYLCVSNEFRALELDVTTPNAGDDTKDSDFDFSPCSYGIIVSGGQVVKRDLGLTKDSTPTEPVDPTNPVDPANPATADGNAISGFVWLDTNGNGLQDTDEPGFAQTVPGLGAPNIALYPVGSTELIDFSYLDENSNGRYRFDNLADGEYYLCVSNEFRGLALEVTTQNAGDNSIDSDFDASPCSYGIVVSGGQVVKRDLGLTGESIPAAPIDPIEPIDPVNPDSSGTIRGFILLDSNGNGLQDSGEIGFAKTIPNFGAPNVELYDADYELVALSPLDEDSNGHYRFGNLTPGIYHLCVSQVYRKIDLFITQLNVGDDDSIDSDFFRSSSCVLEDIILSDQQEAAYDMGLVGDGALSGGSVRGFVGNDRNNNFVFDDNERIITVVTIKPGSFDRVVEEIGMFQRHTVTDSTGFYEFTDLPTGIYNVSCDGCPHGKTIRVESPESRVDANLSSDDPENRNVIKVDGASCTLQQALDAFTLDKQVGSCVSTDPHDALIVLKSGSAHPAIDHVRFPSQLPPLSRIEPRGNFANVKIYGNGARIESFTTKSDPVTFPTQRLRFDDARIINASLGSVTNDQSFVLLRHVTVDNEVATIGERGARGTIPVLFSTIGSAFGHSVFLQNSHVLGDALELRGVSKSVIDGTLSAFSGDPLNPVTLRDSTVNRLKLSPNSIKIESSLISGIFINSFEGKGRDLPDDCFDSDGIVNPHCLLN